MMPAANKYLDMLSLSDTFTLSTMARLKLSKEAIKPDLNLRYLVCHANLLNNLMNAITAKVDHKLAEDPRADAKLNNVIQSQKEPAPTPIPKNELKRPPLSANNLHYRGRTSNSYNELISGDNSNYINSDQDSGEWADTEDLANDSDEELTSYPPRDLSTNYQLENTQRDENEVTPENTPRSSYLCDNSGHNKSNKKVQCVDNKCTINPLIGLEGSSSTELQQQQFRGIDGNDDGDDSDDCELSKLPSLQFISSCDEDAEYPDLMYLESPPPSPPRESVSPVLKHSNETNLNYHYHRHHHHHNNNYIYDYDYEDVESQLDSNCLYPAAPSHRASEKMLKHNLKTGVSINKEDKSDWRSLVTLADIYGC